MAKVPLHSTRDASRLAATDLDSIGAAGARLKGERSQVHYLLFYDVVDDYLTRRTPYRAEHIALARAAAARGELVLGGALASPTDGVVLLFRGDSPAAAEAFAKADPYVVNGVATGWRVREWTTVAGPGAEVILPDVIK